MTSGDTLPVLRIGELSRRTGVPVPTIRGWERRHRYPIPARTTTGYRLYSEADVQGIIHLRSLLDSGMAIAQAVEVLRVRREPWGHVIHAAGPVAEDAQRERLSERLTRALLDLDASAAHEILDYASGALGVESALCDVSLAALRAIGEQWELGQATVAQEHFASNLLRGRTWSLTRGWDTGAGRRVVLAATGGDQHDLPLLMLGVLLRERGWRVTWIGADTPADVLLGVAHRVRPTVTVISMIGRRPRGDEIVQLQMLAQHGVQLAIVGRRATAGLAQQLGAILLEGDLRHVSRQLVGA